MSRPGELMMPTFEIRPGRGVGPVELGMTISEAISALERELGQRIDPSEIYLGADRTRARLPPERAVHLLLDRDQAVETIELAGPPPNKYSDKSLHSRCSTAAWTSCGLKAGSWLS